MSSKIILVTGATGQQGGTVARQLSANGWKVRALVRDPGHPASQSLMKPGIEVVKGDLEDSDSLLRAIKNVYGVFSVQSLDLNHPEKEEQQGKRLAEIAKATGVSHFVYSSAAGADRNTGITSFENKGKIERYIQALNLPATILRPVMFMENFRFTLQKVDGQILLPYKGEADTRVQMIAVQDIGVFARIAFEQPDQFIGQSLEIAGDELSVKELAEHISRFFATAAVYPHSAPVPKHEHDGIKATQFFIREGYKADLEYLRQLHPDLLSFASWLPQSNISF
ncbi:MULTISPECIES: NmrA/HSCARG family protein [Paenibacillus]|uniref:NmrA family transcriptional regulator n=1 Tax=Paenibacillus albilobatus TaxID=2716884 RepID=A0A919XAG6_9BACL|nr:MULTISPECIES: NmrA/HSCARG family protein [Paenibacillus]GIO29031.1 NmrA family transcriptional regulator [Paenibacillus albilobatus]